VPRGCLMGRLADVGMALRDRASLAALTEDVVKTSEIEGEQLNVESVRSSIARRLGVDIGALAPVDRHVEGVVEMVLDATPTAMRPCRESGLFGWHAALFPTGYSGLPGSSVGAGATMPAGPCRWCPARASAGSGAFRGAARRASGTEMTRFLGWANARRENRRCSRRARPPVVRHPAPVRRRQRPHRPGHRRSAAGPRRRQPAALLQPVGADPAERKAYYDILERTQKRSWTSPSGSPGSSTPAHRAVDGRSTRSTPCWPRRASGSAGRGRP
jgi:hypothetical protein